MLQASSSDLSPGLKGLLGVAPPALLTSWPSQECSGSWTSLGPGIMEHTHLDSKWLEHIGRLLLLFLLLLVVVVVVMVLVLVLVVLLLWLLWLLRLWLWLLLLLLVLLLFSYYILFKRFWNNVALASQGTVVSEIWPARFSHGTHRNSQLQGTLKETLHASDPGKQALKVNEHPNWRHKWTDFNSAWMRGCKKIFQKWM